MEWRPAVSGGRFHIHRPGAPAALCGYRPDPPGYRRPWMRGDLPIRREERCRRCVAKVKQLRSPAVENLMALQKAYRRFQRANAKRNRG